MTNPGPGWVAQPLTLEPTSTRAASLLEGIRRAAEGYKVGGLYP